MCTTFLCYKYNSVCGGGGARERVCVSWWVHTGRSLTIQVKDLWWVFVHACDQKQILKYYDTLV